MDRFKRGGVIPLRALKNSKLSEKAVIMGYLKLIFGGVTSCVKRDYAKLSPYVKGRGEF